MKYILIFTLIFSLQVTAQNKLNKVTYNRIINLDAVLEKQKETYSETVLKKIKEKYENYNLLSYDLLFNSTESSCSLNDIETSLESDLKKEQINDIIKIEKNMSYFVSLKQNKTVQSIIMGGERLLLVDSTRQLKWSLKKQSKLIGEYTCFKAQLVNGDDILPYMPDLLIEAWYTPQIPVPFGPLEFEGLPGLILEIKVGNNIYFASEIIFDIDGVLAEPKAGKIVKRKVFINKIKSNIESKTKK